ncbi:putative NRPS-like protein biosynthetic cluster [Termitomyces sp. T32_za158]|nr:putative NRPS-like protein biosynthetic cluster [Termitomyces sp. T32_za158]
MSTSPTVPPLNENISIQDAIQFNMVHNATQPLYIFADSSAPSGIKTITHLEFGRATHRVAHLLRPDRNGVDGEVVALILQTDTVLYQTFVAGLIVAGCVPLAISHRNSPGAIIELLTKTSCRRLLTTYAYLKPLIDSIKSYITGTPFNELRIEEMPSIALIYPYLAHETAEHLFQPYPPAIQQPTRDDICLYLHSSGSTGNPRPIRIAHSFWLDWQAGAYCNCLDLHNPRLTIGSVYGVFSIAVFPPNSALPEPLPPIVPSPENILEHMKLTKSNVIVAPPNLYQIWATLPEAVKYLKTLKHAIYGGGPLAPKMGDLLVEAGVKLNATYGGTEFGINTTFLPSADKDPKDWQYMQLNDKMKPRWVPQGDGTFELQLISHKDHKTMVNNLPDIPGYATSDLWRPHPTKNGLWKIVGRIDDVIVHSSGENTVPAPMEAIIISDPLVRGAVMFGRERDQAGILIEPEPGREINIADDAQLASLRNMLWQVWPTIEEANSVAPAHSRIFKEMILIGSKEKPLPLTPKGTIARKAAIKLYEEEINALYHDVQVVAGERSSPASWSEIDIRTWLLEQASDIAPRAKINPVVDLFQQGFDSLYATSLRLRIVNVFRHSKDPKHHEVVKNLSQNLVYSFPVINDLAAFILSLLLNSPGDLQSNIASRAAAAMETMIAKYSFGFDVPLPPSPQSSVPSPVIVLLTGSTGNLGSQILARLLKNIRVEKVYAYNRPSESGTKTLLQRHTEKFEEVGLDVTLLKSGKLTFISGDAAKPDLGLAQSLYTLLSQTVNVVIHNAWRLDFNLSMESYEPNIQGIRHLVDLVRLGPKPLDSRFLFVSSIGSVQNWDKSKGTVPEDAIEDVSVALGSGYGKAKHVAERILLRSGLQALTFRVGQIIGGPPRGVWPTTEWFPILVKSSISLGAIPVAPGLVSWLYAENISATIVDLSLSKHTTPFPRALNLVHPRPVQQSVIIKSIAKAIADILGHDLKLIPFREWLLVLEKRAEDATVGETWIDVPAIKLLEYFRRYANADADHFATESEADGLPNLSTEKVQRISKFMRSEPLQQIGDNDAKLWVSYWKSTGFLN